MHDCIIFFRDLCFKDGSKLVYLWYSFLVVFFFFFFFFFVLFFGVFLFVCFFFLVFFFFFFFFFLFCFLGFFLFCFFWGVFFVVFFLFFFQSCLYVTHCMHAVYHIKATLKKMYLRRRILTNHAFCLGIIRKILGNAKCPLTQGCGNTMPDFSNLSHFPEDK